MSVAVVMQVNAGQVSKARIALGGVAHKPGRMLEAEALLEGKPVGEALFDQAADRLLQGANGQGANDFKIPLARRAIVRALQQAAAGPPQGVADKRVQ